MTRGLDNYKHLGEEKFYFLFPIITLNVSVINPGNCDFISSCWGNMKRELIGAQPGRNDRDPGDINALCGKKGLSRDDGSFTS